MESDNKTVRKDDLPVISKNIVQRNDFVELKYTGYANGEVFDTNIDSDLKKIDPKAEPKKTVLMVGRGMILEALDNALEGKEIGKEYEITLKPKDAFGERKRELVKTIPLRVFTKKNVNPKPGMTFNMDDALAKVIAVSGARVITDFNNPLSGKEIRYKFTVVRKVSDDKEKIEAVLELLFRFLPEYGAKDDKVIVKGPKAVGPYVDSVKEKFKDLIGKELGFEEKEVKKDKDKKEEGDIAK